jgi:hypothetical protein
MQLIAPFRDSFKAAQRVFSARPFQYQPAESGVRFGSTAPLNGGGIFQMGWSMAAVSNTAFIHASC